MRIDIQNAILLVLCLVLLLSVFSLSASAVTNQVPLSTSSSNPTLLFQSDVTSVYWSAYTQSSVPIYLAYIESDPYAVYLASEVQSQYNYISSANQSGTFSLIYESGDLYYGRFSINGSPFTLLADIPRYADVDDFLSDVSSILWSSVTYSLPPGNIAFIQVPSSRASYTLRTRMPESVLGNNHYPGNNQVLTLVNSLPTGGSAPSSPLIPWQQDGALSVLGLSRNAVYSATNASAGYLCIVNPLYYSGTANGPYEFLSNGSIDITIDKSTAIWVYPLDSSLGFTSGLGISVDTEILNDPYTGTIDPETGEISWTDSSGGTSAPTTGGGNLVSTSETIFDFLRNIADEISTFLKGPIQAIQTVVSAIRQFLSSFTQLYMWLPAPVYNLITSALMIALTIGVIKIFV